MFQNKKAVIFDMDGTLIDSVGIWNAVDMEILSRFGCKGAGDLSEKQVQQQRDELLRKHKGADKPYEEYYRDLKAKYDFTVSAEEAIKARYALAQEMLATRIDYKPGAAEFLKELKVRGFVLAIASTTKKDNMDVYRNKNKNIMSKAPIDETFSLVYTREDVAQMKPDPEIYLKAMKTLGFEPSEFLIFEDSLIGAEAAKASGAEVAVIYDKYSDDEREEINQLADYIIDDYKQALNMLK
ncbi:MAG: HAD family phosphatase [Bacillota bacterium]|nr:HAD family phosphatase [Bacillota bacterium]